MFRFKRTVVVIFIATLLVFLSVNVTSFATVGMSESEPNDLSYTATVIPSSYDLTQEIAGSIGTEGDVDFYTFTPLNSGGYSIATLGTTDTFGYLYDSNMNLLDICDDQIYPVGKNLELRCELTANNTYYIKVTHKDTTATGNYTLKITPVNYKNHEIEPNNSFETANSWGKFATPSSAVIGTPGDEDYFDFTVSSGGSYTFETVGSTDTYGYIYDSNHNLIASDDDSGEGTNMKIVYTISGYKTYYIKIRHWSLSGTGSYSLKVTPNAVSGLDWEGNSFSSASQLTTENYVSHIGSGINFPNDADYFQFTPKVDGIYTFQSTGFTNVYGEVFDSSYTYVKGDDNSGAGDNFAIDVPLIANQNYYLKVTAPDNSTGSYGIDIARGKCLPVPQYLQLPYDNLCWAAVSSMAISYFNNDTINRTLDIAKDYAQKLVTASDSETLYGPNYYTYPSVFNEQANLESCRNYLDSYIESNLPINIYEDSMATPVFTYFRYSLNTLMKSIDNGYPILVTVINSAGGKHILIIKGYKETANGINVIYNDPLDGQEHMENFTGDPTAYVTFYSNFEDIEPNNTIEDRCSIKENEPIQGSIWKSGDVDFYNFAAIPNSQYVIETTGTTDTYGELYDSDGNLIASADNGGQGSNFRITLNLEAYQDYYIKVRHSGTGTGNYSLYLSHTNP